MKRAVVFGIFWLVWGTIVLGASFYILRTPLYLERTVQVDKTESIMLHHGSTISITHESGLVLTSASIDGFEWVRTSGGDRISLSSHEDKAIGNVLNYEAVPPGTWLLSTRHDTGYEVQVTIFAIAPVTVTESCPDRKTPCFSLGQTLNDGVMKNVVVLIMGLFLGLPILLAGLFD